MKRLLITLTSILFGLGVQAQQWTTSGTNIYNSNSGNVGIGTSTPVFKFHVSAASTSVQQRFERTGTGAGVTDVGADNEGLKFFVGGYSASNLRVLFGTNGNVGIGTSGLAARLHVSAPDASVQQRFERTGTGAGITDVGADNEGLKFFVGGYSASNLRVLFGTNGNVGIGTSGLAARLHVSTSDASVQQRLERVGAGGGITDIGTDGDGLKFFVGGYTATSSKVLFGANGKVGIGTFNPDSELTVNGTTHTKEVRVDLTVPGPDYVFEKDYALPSLETVKTYIDQNKHLPEVPSAKEMEANGINLSEMNMLLLKKVEELTLYVIELKREMDKQQSEINNLKK